MDPAVVRDVELSQHREFSPEPLPTRALELLSTSSFVRVLATVTRSPRRLHPRHHVTAVTPSYTRRPWPRPRLRDMPGLHRCGIPSPCTASSSSTTPCFPWRRSAPSYVHDVGAVTKPCDPVWRPRPCPCRAVRGHHLVAKSTAPSPSARLDMHGLCRGRERAFATASSTSAPNPDIARGRRTGSDNHDLAASTSPSPWRCQHRSASPRLKFSPSCVHLAETGLRALFFHYRREAVASLRPCRRCDAFPMPAAHPGQRQACS